MEECNKCDKCGCRNFFLNNNKKICCDCGEIIGVNMTKKKCKVIGCEKVGYREGYCRFHYKEIEDDRYRDAKLEAKERAEKKGEEFNEEGFREAYNEEKKKNIKPENVDKLNKKLGEFE